MNARPVEGLYLITDDASEERLLETVAAALRGGAQVLQYRDKVRPETEQVSLGRRLGKLCREAGAAFLVNDSPRIARAAGADGVHLGQGDTGIAESRAILGEKAIVGVSTRTVDQARRAEAEGADYIGLGSIYPTGTKGDAVHVGLDTLRQVRQAVRLPIVAIGGIDREGAGAVVDAGADAAAVVSAVMGDADPQTAAREIALQFNRRRPLPRGRVLTVAGSDSGGGAGIQADLKTVALLGGYGMSAITALTAQNTLGVKGVHPAPAAFVAAQIETVLEDLGADVVKTGMLFSSEIIREVARALERFGLLAVIDPVMIAKGGARLLQDDAVASLRQDLLPRTYLLTPNLPEAEALTGTAIASEAQMEQAARRLQEAGARNVLIKGGHLEGDAVDLLLDGDTLHRFPAARHATKNTHGTGCTYAAAIAAFLAQGRPLPDAVERAKTFIDAAIRTATDLGGGHGPVNHWQAAQAVGGEK